MKIFKSFICAACMAFLLAAGGCAPEKAQKSVIAMDTVVTLTAQGPEAEAAVTEGAARAMELEKLLSPYEADSDASRLAASAGSGEWVKISPEMLHLLKVTQRISALSGGAFDVTSAPLVELWGIGTEQPKVPSADEIVQARALVDFRKLELDEDRSAARLTAPGMHLDLGGVLKGFAADEIRRIYEKHGVKNGLVSLGTSSMLALGGAEGRGYFNIGLRNPRGDEGAPFAVVELSDEALSTSGDYERFFEEGGVRYHHILDPATGAPAHVGEDVRPMSVTIIARGEDAGLLTDLLTTAVFVLGPERGLKLLDALAEEGVSGEITTTDKVIHASEGFELKDVDEGFALVK